MTASAIQGDREKCLQSGMNNYLAKPVRAQTLKALLESYLSKQDDGKEIPNIQAEANKMVKDALKEAAERDEANAETDGVKVEDSETREKNSRPSSIRTNTTQRWHPHEENGQSQTGHS